MAMNESPLFSRAYDLLREACKQSERMPRSRRAVLGRRMEEAAFDVHEAITGATQAKDPLESLRVADLALARWRICLRLGVDLALFTEGRATELMTLTAEAGRLLGGWRKKLAR